MRDQGSKSRSFEERAQDALEGKKRGSWLARLLPFLGPAFIASVAYIDPGNFATNIEAGARFNYLLDSTTKCNDG